MKLELTRRRKIILGAAVSLLLLWLFWPDRSLAKVRALRDELGQAQTPEEREAKGRERRRQQMLDNSTPRERELRDLFRRDMDQRRRERGLPPSPPGRGGR